MVKRPKGKGSKGGIVVKFRLIGIQIAKKMAFKIKKAVEPKTEVSLSANLVKNERLFKALASKER